MTCRCCSFLMVALLLVAFFLTAEVRSKVPTKSRSERRADRRSRRDSRKSSDDSSSDDATQSQTEDIPESALENLITPLTNENFDTLLQDSIWIVKFYAPWCKHCQHFEPIYKKIAYQSYTENDYIHFGEVNCEVDFIMCHTYDINGYPSIAILVNGVMMEDFNGNRNKIATVVEWVNDITRATLETIEAGNADKYQMSVENPQLSVRQSDETDDDDDDSDDDDDGSRGGGDAESSSEKSVKPTPTKRAKKEKKRKSKLKNRLAVPHFKFPWEFESISDYYEYVLGETHMSVPIFIYVMGTFTGLFVGIVFVLFNMT